MDVIQIIMHTQCYLATSVLTDLSSWYPVSIFVKCYFALCADAMKSLYTFTTLLIMHFAYRNSLIFQAPSRI